VYVRAAFGDMMGFFTCWGYWVMAWISNCVLVVAIVSYLLPLIPEYSTYSLYFQISSLVLLTLINLFSVNMSAKCDLLITIFKIIPLFILPLIGIFWINLDHFQITSVSEPEFWGSLNTVAFLALWGFIGLETGTVPGGQVDKPIKTIPRAVITGTFIAMMIYVLGMVSTIGIIPAHDLAVSKAPYADIAGYIFGGNWGTLVSIIAIVSIIGTLHGWILVVGQTPLGAVKDGLFPEIFGAMNRFGSPYVGILISSFCTLMFIILSHNENLVKQFQFIIEISITIIFVIYFLCVLSYWKLIKKERGLHVSEAMLIVGALAFIMWAMFAASIQMVALSTLGFVLGMPVYVWVKRENRKN
jgi:APA family basic amino acid/polyamine antiporter